MFCSLLFLNGCLQSTAMVGPSITLAGGGSIYQSGFSYGVGKIFHEETGMSTTEFAISILNDENKKIKSRKKN